MLLAGMACISSLTRLKLGAVCWTVAGRPASYLTLAITELVWSIVARGFCPTLYQNRPAITRKGELPCEPWITPQIQANSDGYTPRYTDWTLGAPGTTCDAIPLNLSLYETEKCLATSPHPLF